MEIRFPIVEGHVFQTTNRLLKCDVAKIEPLAIDPNLEPTTTVVQHSDWEAKSAQLLEVSDLVERCARNDHLGLTIKYEYFGIDHDYEPDFIVRLANDLILVLEIKGFEVHNKEQTNAKHNAARKWVTAVNNQGEFGRWDFLVCQDVALLAEKLAALVGLPADGGGTTIFNSK